MLINKFNIAKISTDLFDLFFPETCLNCGNLQEIRGKYLCFFCLSEVPLTNFSFQSENELENSFKGRIPLHAATSLMYFEKNGMVQKLIHELKYNNKPEIGTFLGKWLAEEMRSSKRFEMIDLVVPVPLHPDKQKKRGYNQVHAFAHSLAEGLNARLGLHLLRKIRNNQSQTSKNRQQRVVTKEDQYLVTDKILLKGKHILLVDDTITTGATMQACADSLSAVSDIKISLASMACTV